MLKPIFTSFLQYSSNLLQWINHTDLIIYNINFKFLIL